MLEMDALVASHPANPNYRRNHLALMAMEQLVDH